MCRLIPCLAVFLAPARAELERHPTRVGTYIDVGRIVQGRLVGNSFANTVSADGQFLTRTGVYLTQSATFDQKFRLQLTLGGLFYFALPEQKNNPSFRFVQFGPGVGDAQASYAFGDPNHPAARLLFGLFPVKYNPDAKNLGEYLYRSGTYPPLRYTGGWSYLNSAAYMAQGVRFWVPTLGGTLVHEVSLTMERDLQPNYDLSPAYLVSFKPLPFVELGGGVMWAHALSFNDSLLAPEDPQNGYDKATGRPLSYRDPNYINRKNYSTGDARIRPEGDPCLDNTNPCFDRSYVSASENGVPGERLAYYTFRGVKTMARFSFDLGAVLGFEAGEGHGDFKLYGEWALLGVRNQPFYYDKLSERMPVMLGLDIPTFGVLDAFSFEVEYLKSRFRNNLNLVFQRKWPIPLIHEQDQASIYNLDDPRYSPDYDETLPVNEKFPALDRSAMEERMGRDDWKWSVYARKNLTEGLSLTGQAASDHLRHFTYDNGPRPMDFAATEFVSDWYFILRMELQI